MLSPKTYEHVSCILCGTSQTRSVARKGQFGWDTYVSICTNCGLVYLDPRWTKADYNQFYATEYDQYYRFDESQASEKERRKAVAVWKRLVRHTPAAFKSALDIGCGLGYCLQYIQEQAPGLAIAGIEPSDSCADHFVHQIGGELVARDVEQDWQEANRERFDLVIFRHVLEHLLDPVAVLRKVSQSMAPGGVLYIAVPDMFHPDGSLFDFWFRCVHTYYYSKVTLSRIARRAGLQPITIQEESSELWGIFQKGLVDTTPEAASVYKEQMAALNRYKRQRMLRSLFRVFSPAKISPWIPKPVKKLVPQSLKKRFRRLVYRH